MTPPPPHCPDAPCPQAALAADPRLPSAMGILEAPWSTLIHVPAAVAKDWSKIFLGSLQTFCSNPSDVSLARLLLTTKGVLAVPKRAGHSRKDATERLLRRRLSLFHAGRYGALWQAVATAWKPRSRKKVAAAPTVTNRSPFIH